MKQVSFFDKSPSGAHVIVETVEWTKKLQNIMERRTAPVGLLNGGDRVVRTQGNHIGRHQS